MIIFGKYLENVINLKNKLNLFFSCIKYNLMIIYNISPNTPVNSDKLQNIMNNLTNDIGSAILLNSNIIYENNYKNLITTIFDIVHKYIKIYKFYPMSFSNLYVQIYNTNIDVISYLYFNLTKYNFSIIVSSWENFYFGLTNTVPIVFGSLSNTQKNELRYATTSGDLYLVDNLIFLYNSKLTKGIILKKKYCSCQCEKKSCDLSNYIVTVYWN